MSTSGDVESPSNSSSLPNSLPGSASGSPRTKIKFLCSHGGKILPRPTDGHLKYVGGETRVISVHRYINFTDIMKKLSSLMEGDVILKYQMLPEDLDALVTVKSDEDLRHMFEEYDRSELIGTPRLRTFLFPANPVIIENQIGPMDRHTLEQRYINSVNGLFVYPTSIYNSNFKPTTVNTSQTSFTISSACSSPRTPPEANIHSISTMPSASPDVLNPEISNFRKLGSMTRARSSPNLCNLGSSCQTNQKNPSNISTLNLGLSNQQHPYHHQHRQWQPQPQPQPLPHHMYQQPHPQSQPFPKPPLDSNPHKNYGPDHLMRMRSTGLANYSRHPMDHSPQIPNPYPRSSRGGNMVYPRGSPYDEYYGNNRYDRESPPGSPLAPSPLQSNYMSKWDSLGSR